MKKPYTLLNKAEPYLWILPSVILMAIFIIVPIGSVFQMAMSDVNKAGIIKGYAGFENFEKISDDPEWRKKFAQLFINFNK